MGRYYGNLEKWFPLLSPKNDLCVSCICKVQYLYPLLKFEGGTYILFNGREVRTEKKTARGLDSMASGRAPEVKSFFISLIIVITSIIIIIIS